MTSGPLKNDPHGDRTSVSAEGRSGGNPKGTLTARKLWSVFRDETRLLRPRVLLARLLLAPLPPNVGSRVRVALLRRLGFSLGHGTVMWGLPLFGGEADLHRMLEVGACCRFNVGCVLDLSAPITIGDHVGLGYQVMLLTTTHDLGGGDRRSTQPVFAPITVGDGCWLGSRSTVLPGVTIGRGSVVAAGAMVTKDVPPDTLVAGVPARVIRQLES